MNKFQSVVLVFGGIMIGACVSHVAPMLAANAAGGPRCDYTYIVDSGPPDIGEAGEVHYDDEWGGVLAGGFSLKAITGSIYVFERCR